MSAEKKSGGGQDLLNGEWTKARQSRVKWKTPCSIESGCEESHFVRGRLGISRAGGRYGRVVDYCTSHVKFEGAGGRTGRRNHVPAAPPCSLAPSYRRGQHLSNIVEQTSRA